MNYEDNYSDNYSFARAHMTPDEHILWRGEPQKGHLFKKADIFMIPFSLLWFGFVVFWEVGVLQSDAPIIMPLFGLIGLFAGLYFVFGRFIYAAYMQKRTKYVITNKKILRLRGQRVDILTAATMPPAHWFVNKDGSGSVYFRSYNGPQYNGSMATLYPTGMTLGVFSIENVSQLMQVQSAIDRMDR